MSTATDNFIGRDQEIAFLTRWLEETQAPSIVYIHDALKEKELKGGIGKSTLLARFYELVVRDHKNIIPVRLDFFEIRDRDAIFIAEQVFQALKRRYPHWSAGQFNKLLAVYRQEMREKKAGAGLLPERLADALSNDLHTLQQRMIDDNTYVLLFLDTYELIEYNPVTAVLQSTWTFPDNYQSERFRFLIAGRNALDWSHQNWKQREAEVYERPLPPFSYDETVDYLTSLSEAYDIASLPRETLQAFYERTRGRPILVGLVADVLNNRLQTPEKLAKIPPTTFEASLVEEINHLKDPRKSLILAMAHVYHRFDAAFLEHLRQWPGLGNIISKLQYRELVHELSSLSFIRHSSTSERLVLHDEMRRLVNTYCWQTNDEDERMRRELSTLALTYYDQLIAHEKNEETRQSYIVERLFHKLFLDRDNGFRSFTQHFDYALNFSLHAFARALVQELAKFKDRLTTEQRLVAELAEARVLREEENPEAALAILLALEQDGSWAQRYRFDLLEEKGSCYLRLYQYPQTIDCFEGCLEIARKGGNNARYAQQLSRLGYVHRLQGHYSKAMTYYEEALRVQRNLDNPGEYATLLNNISNVLRLQGKLDDALRLCKLALRMRRDLFKQGKVSEHDVGLSMSTLGHIYHNMGDVFEEDTAYREAYEIYSRVGDKKAIAAIYNYLGRIWMKKRDKAKARESFEEALRIAAGVRLDVEIESYNQIGRLDLSEKQWQEAHDLFERAVERSRAIGLEFELAENLLYLALTLDYLERPSDEHIKEAKRFARRNGHSYVLALAGEIQGDMLLRRGEYLSAFKYYRVACRYYAERSTPEYDKFLRSLNDKLLELPATYLPGVIDLLRSYWNELGLDKSYPQLPSICREVSRHMLL